MVENANPLFTDPKRGNYFALSTSLTPTEVDNAIKNFNDAQELFYSTTIAYDNAVIQNRKGADLDPFKTTKINALKQASQCTESLLSANQEIKSLIPRYQNFIEMIKTEQQKIVAEKGAEHADITDLLQFKEDLESDFKKIKEYAVELVEPVKSATNLDKILTQQKREIISTFTVDKVTGWRATILSWNVSSWTSALFTLQMSAIFLFTAVVVGIVIYNRYYAKKENKYILPYINTSIGPRVGLFCVVGILVVIVTGTLACIGAWKTYHTVLYPSAVEKAIASIMSSV